MPVHTKLKALVQKKLSSKINWLRKESKLQIYRICPFSLDHSMYMVIVVSLKSSINYVSHQKHTRLVVVYIVAKNVNNRSPYAEI